MVHCRKRQDWSATKSYSAKSSRVTDAKTTNHDALSYLNFPTHCSLLLTKFMNLGSQSVGRLVLIATRG
jgi:hypothetical protein